MATSPATRASAREAATGTGTKQAAGKRPAARKQATKTTATKKTSAAKKSAAKKTVAKKAATAKRAASTKTAATRTATRAARGPKLPSPDRTGDGPVLLSGGNPQIPKGEGRAPVQAYLDAMPGWKHDIGVALDAIVMRTLPDAHLWVKWNSPFYGADEGSWFASFHCFDRFVRVTFCQGESLDPMPAGTSKIPAVRYHDVGEHDDIDDEVFGSWVAQASRLPGERF